MLQLLSLLPIIIIIIIAKIEITNKDVLQQN